MKTYTVTTTIIWADPTADGGVVIASTSDTQAYANRASAIIAYRRFVSKHKDIGETDKVKPDISQIDNLTIPDEEFKRKFGALKDNETIVAATWQIIRRCGDRRSCNICVRLTNVPDNQSEDYIDPEILFNLAVGCHERLAGAGMPFVEEYQTVLKGAREATGRHCGTDWDAKDFWETMEKESDCLVRGTIGKKLLDRAGDDRLELRLEETDLETLKEVVRKESVSLEELSSLTGHGMLHTECSVSRLLKNNLIKVDEAGNYCPDYTILERTWF